LDGAGQRRSTHRPQGPYWPVLVREGPAVDPKDPIGRCWSPVYLTDSLQMTLVVSN